MSLRVLHVVPAVAARYGGPSVAAIGMCRALQAAGVQTLLATTDADGAGRLSVAYGTIHRHEGVPAIFFRRQIGQSFKWSSALANWLTKHVVEYDLVHIHAVFNHASLAAGRACRAARVPYIVRPLGTLDPWSLNRHARRKRLIFTLGARKLLTSAAAMHYTAAAEQQLAERALSWLPRGIVVPLGIEDELFDETTPARREPVVLAMGRIDPKKGIDLLIDAFHLASADGSLGGWQLVIAGDGEAAYASKLHDRARDGAARESIRFQGWVSGTQRRDLLRSARLFALPSVQENFGLALVEAMASGLPVVVTLGVNLAVEIETAGAGWIAGRSCTAVAEVLRAAVADTVALATRGHRARLFAERFRWSHVVEVLQRHYTDVLCGVPSVSPKDFSRVAQR